MKLSWATGVAAINAHLQILVDSHLNPSFNVGANAIERGRRRDKDKRPFLHTKGVETAQH